MSESDARGSQIAVVGMSGRFPGASDLTQYWRNLRGGVESITFFEPAELEAAGVDPALLRDPAYVRSRGIVEGQELFDAGFFRLSPGEAAAMDPQHRLFLECAWHALEDAGCDPRRFDGPIGVFAGSTPGGGTAERPGTARPSDSVQAALGRNPAYLPSRVSYKLGLTGPSLSIQTACSTSLVAVHLACQSLLAGECDLALAGGVSLAVPQRTGHLHEPGGVLSPDGHCRAFDARAGGFVNGHGLGLVVLKRLPEALEEGDAVRAVIRGSAINNDGAEKVGFTAPGVDGQEAVIAEALAVAGVEPETVTYVEAHGTATALGDPIEVAALTRAFDTDRRGFCALGSVKTNIGHLGEAAGVAGLIKTVLALEHRQIPPSLLFETPNPEIDFAGGPFFVQRRLTPWPGGETPRRAGVSAFGLGGTNAHLVLEEAPPTPPSGPSRKARLLLLSAGTAGGLDRARTELADRLEDEPPPLADIAYTLQTGRRRFAHRAMALGAGAAGLAEALRARDPRRCPVSSGEPDERPVAFLLPGTGELVPGMARRLYRREPAFRREIDRCAELLRPDLGLDLRRVLYPEAGDEAGLLGRTVYAQPAIFALEVSLARLWQEWGISPRALLGHSLGEYAAACLAGVFSLEQGLALVARRARLLESLPAGAMLAVSLPAEELKPLLGEELSLAAVNGPDRSVAAGPPETIARLERRLADAGTPARRLGAKRAFHSQMMAPAVEPFLELLATIEPRAPRLPYLSNVSGTWITAGEATDPRYWARHLCSSVRFAEGLRELTRDPARVLLEVGPGQALSALARRACRRRRESPVVLPSLPAAGAAAPEDEVLLRSLGRLWLAGARIDWQGFYRHERRSRVTLPGYPFERRSFGGADSPATPAPARPDGRARRTPPAAKRRPLADWFYLPSWRPSVTPPASPAAEPRHWLVFHDRGPLPAALLEHLRAAGHRVAEAVPGARYEPLGDRLWSLEPGVAEGYRRLFEDLRSRNEMPDAVLHLWSLREGLPEPPAEESLARTLDRGFYSLLFLIQGREAAGGVDPLDLVAVSSSMHEVVAGEPLDPATATLLGPCRVIPQEHPAVRCRSIDLDLPADDAGRRRLVELLARELARGEEATVAYRGGRRWLPDAAAVRLPAAPDPPRRLRRRGLYLITGGLGGVGSAIAEYLAETARARLLLTGRTALPPRPERDHWLEAHGDGEPTSRRLATIRRLEAAGAAVLYARADAADPTAMAAALRQAEERFGELRGAVHAAGTTAPDTFTAVLETGRAEAEAQLAPKVTGVLVLERLLAERELDFCLLTSSISSHLGGMGFASYAAANAFLDAFARHRCQQAGVPWISVDWDGWRLSGDRRGRRQGFGAELAELAMTASEGRQALARILAAETEPQIVVSTSDLPDRRLRWVDFKPRDGPAASGGAERHGRPEVDVAFAAPEDLWQRRIAGLWTEILGVDRIDAGDDFLELGGDSLLAIRVLSRLRRRFGIELPLAHFFQATTVAALARAVEAAAAGDGDRAAGRATGRPQRAASSSREGAGEALSLAQERLWFLDRLEPPTGAYNVAAAWRLEGRLDAACLSATLGEVERRHQVLRANFAELEGRPVQVVQPPRPVPLPAVDLGRLKPEARAAEATRLLAAEAHRPFDLERGALLRPILLRLDGREHRLLIAMHHIVTDGWSLAVLQREISELYRAAAGARPSPLPELAIQYAEVSRRQRRRLEGEALEGQIAFWRQELRGLTTLRLPADRPHPPRHGYRGAAHAFTLPAALTAALKRLAADAGATLFMTLLAGYMALLHRLTGQHDVAVGSAVAGRGREDVEGLIGFFVNTLVLRGRLAGDPSCRRLLRRLKDTTLGAFDHQDLPFARLVEELQPERDLAHLPLCQVTLTLQSVPRSTLELPGVEATPVELEARWARFELELFLTEREGRLDAALAYNTDLFDATTVRRFAGQLATLLEGLVADPERRLAELPLLPRGQRHQLLAEWNDREARFPGGACLHHLFRSQAAHTPAAVAVVSGDRRLSYRELDRRARRLAGRLRALGVGPETRVGLAIERSPEMVIAILGVLGAGGAYVPLDPSYPEERLTFMLKDAGARIVLTADPAIGRRLRNLPEAPRVVGLGEPGQAGGVAGLAEGALAPDHPAYVIYTSGSTGRPKGVVNSHRGIVNRLEWMRRRFDLTPADRVLHKTPLSFDVSIWEIFWPLQAGATLVLARPGGHLDPAYLRALIGEHGITHLHFVPSMLQLFLEQPELEPCRTVRRVFCSGEALSRDLRRRFFARWQASLHDLYGPTEAAIEVTHRACRPPPPARAATIGRPIANTRILLLDRRLGLAPIGVPAELSIGGVQLARGYSGRPARTARAFLPDPSGDRPGRRLYRTGDVARHRQDGNVEFLGRRDHQVKIRGTRIEPGEVEAVLELHPRIREATVVPAVRVHDAATGAGDPSLVAFVVREAGTRLPAGDMRRFLGHRLPAYMLPSIYHALDALPLTPSGKVDRRALARAAEDQRPEAESAPSLRLAEPRTPVEHALAGIWRRLLGIRAVGIHDNFFKLGGHSLLATRVLSRVRRSLGAELPLRAVFETPTIAQLARRLEQAREPGGATEPPLEPVDRRRSPPLSFAQQRHWFLHRHQPANWAFNVPLAYRLSGELQTAALDAALREITRRHEILRTTFTDAGGRPRQVVRPPPDRPLVILDLTALPAAARRLLARRAARDDTETPFDLGRGPLLRSTLLRLAPEEHILVFTLHHLVCDGWSLGVLLGELAVLYDAFTRGRPSPLPELAFQYADYAFWQHRRLAGEPLEAILAYWRPRLRDAAILELPADRPRPATLSGGGSARRFEVSIEVTTALRRLGLETGNTLFTVLLTALMAQLHRLTGQRRISVCTVVGQRRRPELEATIGCFMHAIVLTGRVDDATRFADLLDQLKESTLDAYAHQDLPFEQLVSELEPDLYRHPLFQVSTALELQPPSALELRGLSTRPVGVGARTTCRDLKTSFKLNAGALSYVLTYSTDLFDASSIERMARELHHLLTALAEDPDRRIKDLAPAMVENDATHDRGS